MNSTGPSPRTGISRIVDAVDWKRLLTAMGLSFWAVTGLIIPIFMIVVSMLIFKNWPMVVIGAALLYSGLVMAIYNLEAHVDD